MKGKRAKETKDKNEKRGEDKGRAGTLKREDAIKMATERGAINAQEEGMAKNNRAFLLSLRNNLRHVNVSYEKQDTH